MKRIFRIYKSKEIVTKSGKQYLVADGDAVLITGSITKVEKFLEHCPYNTLLR